MYCIPNKPCHVIKIGIKQEHNHFHIFRNRDSQTYFFNVNVVFEYSFHNSTECLLSPLFNSTAKWQKNKKKVKHF